MLSAFIAQLQAGKPLSEKQVQAGKNFFDMFYTVLHHHHDNEEKIGFPFLAKRAEIPARITEDHVSLMECLDQASELFKAALDSSEMGASIKYLTEVQVGSTNTLLYVF